MHKLHKGLIERDKLSYQIQKCIMGSKYYELLGHGLSEEEKLDLFKKINSGEISDNKANQK